MQSNIGALDRFIRFLIGFVVMGLALFSGLPPFTSTLGFWVAIGVGAILIATSVAKVCPAYIPFNISTVGTDR